MAESYLVQRRRSHSHSAGAVVRERNRLERELAEGEAESEAREEGPHLALSGLVCRRPSYTGRPPRVPLVLSLRLGGRDSEAAHSSNQQVSRLGVTLWGGEDSVREAVSDE
ncbi:unnamed protein product, partial [Gadus morhua 'NCC']